VPGAGLTHGPVLIVLDIGQGDAIILRDAADTTMLIDTGPDPGAMLDALERHGIDAIDLVVITHPHRDHDAGLATLVDRVAVGAVWRAPDSADVRTADDGFGTFMAPSSPRPGEYQIGDIAIEVLGPVRRYASANDQSIVLRVTINGVAVLLTGDVEEYAQADLGAQRSHVLKVPHYGGATSDLAWLAATQASVAVISVGDNSFGHPADDVINALVAAAWRFGEPTSRAMSSSRSSAPDGAS
jgi:competence protein ComEC